MGRLSKRTLAFKKLIAGQLDDAVDTVLAHLYLTCKNSKVPLRRRNQHVMALWETLHEDICRAVISELSEKVYKKIK